MLNVGDTITVTYKDVLTQRTEPLMIIQREIIDSLDQSRVIKYYFEKDQKYDTVSTYFVLKDTDKGYIFEVLGVKMEIVDIINA
jgi:hypothetical protein